MTQIQLPLEKQLCNPPRYTVDSKKQIPLPFEVLSIVSMTTKVKIDLIKGDSRIDAIVQPRFLAAYFMYEWCGFSSKQVALYLNYDDRSSIVHARQTVEDALSLKKSYLKSNAEKIEKVLQSLYKKYERPQKEVYVSPFSKN